LAHGGLGITGFIYRPTHDFGFFAVPLPQMPEIGMGLVQGFPKPKLAGHSAESAFVTVADETREVAEDLLVVWEPVQAPANRIIPAKNQLKLVAFKNFKYFIFNYFNSPLQNTGYLQKYYLLLSPDVLIWL
jgi:hypothetical protein